jgi:hypothetical protein
LEEKLEKIKNMPKNTILYNTPTTMLDRKVDAFSLKP